MKKVVLMFISVLIFGVMIFGVMITSCKTAVLSNNGTDLFEYPEVDKKPMYRGMEPMQAFNELVAKSIKYPPEALEKGISGFVTMSFVIEKNGSVSNVRILQAISRADPLLKAEALRATELLYKTKWTPGVKNGKKVRVVLNHPVSFKLNK